MHTTKVLFISGPGRSGSTLVAEILGQYPSVVNAGEMLWYFNKRDVEPPSRCGCGEALRSCDFWEKVMSRVPAGEDLTPGQVREFYKMRPIPYWPGLYWRGRKGPMTSQPARILDEMYGSIAEVSGASMVVDASKLPGVALVASTLPDVDLYVLHLTRDPRSVVNAWRKPKKDPLSPADNLGKRGAGQVIRWWLARSLASEWLLRRRVPEGHFFRVSYEEFADAPREVIGRVMEFAGVDQSGSPFRGPSEVELSSSHTVIGNPDRHSTGVRTITRRDRWPDELPRLTRLATVVATWPVMRWFGYR